MNDRLSARQASPSLWDPLLRPRAQPDGPLLSVWDGDRWTDLSWNEWISRAARFAGGLRRLGVSPGDRVAIELRNSPAACAAVLGTWMAGGCLVSLPGVARGISLDRYVTQLERIIAQAEPAMVLIEGAAGAALRPSLSEGRVRATATVDGPPVDTPDLPQGPAPVFVQYSSGSTSEPRGCVLSADAIARQLAMLERALGQDPEQAVGVHWLPLSHDMGLFGCLLLCPYWIGIREYLSTPERFLMSPWTWFDDCARFGASDSCGPNFSLELAARVAGKLPPAGVPLRRLVVGGERVDVDTLERACRALGPERLPRAALIPAYGMAEAVLALTMTSPGTGPTVMSFARDDLARGHIDPLTVEGTDADADAMAMVSCGPPLPEVDVRIAGPRAVGEIVVRSPSLAGGYFNRSEDTRERFGPAGLHTRDIGFMHDGELYVTARTDDLLQVAGRNVYARDIEHALGGLAGVRPGACAVVSDSSQRFTAVIELADHHPDMHVLAEQVRELSRRTAAVTVTDCLFLPRGAFPKTPSGKVQRFRCRELASAPTVTAGAHRVSA